MDGRDLQAAATELTRLQRAERVQALQIRESEDARRVLEGKLTAAVTEVARLAEAERAANERLADTQMARQRAEAKAVAVPDVAGMRQTERALRQRLAASEEARQIAETRLSTSEVSAELAQRSEQAMAFRFNNRKRPDVSPPKPPEEIKNLRLQNASLAAKLSDTERRCNAAESRLAGADAKAAEDRAAERALAERRLEQSERRRQTAEEKLADSLTRRSEDRGREAQTVSVSDGKIVIANRAADDARRITAETRKTLASVQEQSARELDAWKRRAAQADVECGAARKELGNERRLHGNTRETVAAQADSIALLTGKIAHLTGLLDAARWELEAQDIPEMKGSR